MNIPTGVVVGGGVALLAALTIIPAAAQRVEAPQFQIVTPSGFRVEEARVGTSCVVIISRMGSGTSDYASAVPCTR